MSYQKYTPNRPIIMSLYISSISALVFLTFTTLTPLLNHHHPKPPLHFTTHLQNDQNTLRYVESTCNGTLYPSLCVSTLSTLPNLRSKSLPEIIAATLNGTFRDVSVAESNVSIVHKKFPKLPALETRALEDCKQLFDTTVSELRAAIADLAKCTTDSEKYHDLQTVLSAAMTNQATCLDGFAFSKSRRKIRKFFRHSLTVVSRHCSNSLALLKKIKRTKTKSDSGPFPGYDTDSNGFPTWLSKKDRRLLQAPVTSYNVSVAQDGSGNYTTIGDAVAAAPNASSTRYVIYIKAGAYFEYVDVPSSKRMLMFVGDGIGKTWIKGNRSVIDGWTTYGSATVAVKGSGFIAKGISIENYAGAIKHQAVALRTDSDFSAFYQCSFIGYQDTLYVHTLRQFFRECDIYGTIDFIFGNAAVVFQNCNLYARLPLSNQQNIFTAQGREDPNQNTGISLINCKIAAGSELIPNVTMVKSYLGRPWKEYSRTVIMLSNIESLIDPAGWLEWNGTFALSTLYYGEYMNRGPGSNTSARVTWPGYRVITNATEAAQFTARNFIQGGDWLPSYGIPYYLGLSV